LNVAIESAENANDTRLAAGKFCNEVKPLMEIIREAADELEGIVDDQYWPLVKYRELLVIR
jgi:glutamine synthetase